MTRRALWAWTKKVTALATAAAVLGGPSLAAAASPKAGKAGSRRGARDLRSKAPIVARLTAEGRALELADEAAGRAVAAHAALRDLLEELLARASRRRRPAGLRAEARRAKRRLVATGQALASAEAELDRRLEALWGGFERSRARATLVDEPLRAALLELAVRFRRMVGGRFHTEVSGLSRMPGCRGDLVRDRLLARYGAAVADRAADSALQAELLGQVASQLACLSAEQTRILDAALYQAYDDVFALLAKRRLGDLQPAFARMVAPVMLLVLDTVKHRGEAAAAWYWFRDHREILKDEIGRVGWATGGVYWLYDRIDGRLIGLPPCGRRANGRCVDAEVLLDSLADPAALGLGDCAFSGMVASGPTELGSRGLRYACASGCDKGSTGGSGSLDPGRGDLGGRLPSGLPRNPAAGFPGAGGLELPWSALSARDYADMQAACGPRGGGAGGTGSSSPQGPAGGLGDWGGLDECVAGELDQPRNPFAAYAQCVTDAVGPGFDPAEALATGMSGVPADPKCSLMDGEDDGGTAGDDGASGDDGAGTDDGGAAADGGAKEESTASKLWNAIKQFFSIPTSPSATGAVVSAELELLDPENGKKIYDTAEAVIRNRIELKHAAGEITDGEKAALDKMKPGDAAEWLKNNNKWRSCASPEDCDDSCTGLNAQLAERMECEMDFIDSMLPPEYQGGPRNPNDPGHVINPDPMRAPEGEIDGVLGCLLAQAGGAETGDPACGLVQCADGLATSWSGSECCADLGGFGGAVPIHDSCLAMQCADGNPTVGENGVCTCDGAAPGGEAPAPPAPGPELGGGPAAGGPSLPGGFVPKGAGRGGFPRRR